MKLQINHVLERVFNHLHTENSLPAVVLLTALLLLLLFLFWRVAALIEYDCCLKVEMEVENLWHWEVTFLPTWTL